MPSRSHEALIAVFRTRPELVVDMLTRALGVELPAFDELRDGSADLGDVAPAEYRADAVVVLSRAGAPVLAVVIEVQLERKRDKLFSWPVYVAMARARNGCAAALLVISPRAGVARWCARPIDLGHPGLVLRPIVLGPAAIPVVAEPTEAMRAPELALLSVLAHGRGPDGRAVGLAMLAAAERLDEERGKLYADLAIEALGAAARKAVEDTMENRKEARSGEFGERYWAWRQQERREAIEEGLAKGRAESVVAVLAARGIAVAPEVRERILGCTDLATLDAWIQRAVTVTRVDELFDAA